MARGSVLVIVALQLLLVNRLTVGPLWLVPVFELLLLAPLSAMTAETQYKIGSASSEHHWNYIATRLRLMVRLAMSLNGLITAINLYSLFKLILALLDAHSKTNGRTLLIDAVDLWVVNIIAFGLWYWTIDRGGVAQRGVVDCMENDFLFPQMASQRDSQWAPGFIDYLYVSFTNAAAFSPTDTMPLTRRAKLLMMIQSGISLVTVALVAARAVNILS
jgi:hypothetical protein